MQNNVLYRCDWQDSNLDSETFSQQKIEILFTEYRVIKQTEKTYTIRKGSYGGAKTTVVLKDQSGKRYAYATKERALEAFIIKRNSYGGRLKQSIKNNDRLIGIATELAAVLKGAGDGNR